MDRDNFDVIVVGCGIAGLSAAITAQQNGARVAILERATKDERGGNTRYTESFWRMKSEDAVSDDFEDRFAANAGGWPDPGIVRDAVRDRENQPAVLRALGVVDPNLIATIADEAPKALKWLTAFGIKFDFLPLYFLSQSTTRMGPIGGGLALVEALGGYVDERPEDIEVFYETGARELIRNDDGAIIGVKAVGRGNKQVEFRGCNVVLASGGVPGKPGNVEPLCRSAGPVCPPGVSWRPLQSRRRRTHGTVSRCRTLRGFRQLPRAAGRPALHRCRTGGFELFIWHPG